MVKRYLRWSSLYTQLENQLRAMHISNELDSSNGFHALKLSNEELEHILVWLDAALEMRPFKHPRRVVVVTDPVHNRPRMMLCSQIRQSWLEDGFGLPCSKHCCIGCSAWKPVRWYRPEQIRSRDAPSKTTTDPESDVSGTDPTDSVPES